MYIFEAKYQNMENGEERTETIKVYDDMPEAEIYVAAMRRAYEMKKPHECLCAVEFLAC